MLLTLAIRIQNYNFSNVNFLNVGSYFVMNHIATLLEVQHDATLFDDFI